MKRATLTGLVCSLLAILVCSGCTPSKVPGKVTPWRFAVFCDTRGEIGVSQEPESCVNGKILGPLAEAVAREGVDLAIVPGDLINGCGNPDTPYEQQFEAWRAAVKPLVDAGVAIYPIRGNHEAVADKQSLPWPPEYPLPEFEKFPEIAAAFVEVFDHLPNNGPEEEKQLTYSFSHKNAFFVAMDVYFDDHKVNQPWLNEQLQANSLPHVFAYTHEAAFKVGHADCLAYFPEERDAFWDSLGAAGTRLYFCGHDHLYNRAAIKDRAGNTIHQALIGSSGAPMSTWAPPYSEGDKVVGEFHNEQDYGYAIVTIEGDTVTYEWKAWNGEGTPIWTTSDRFSYSVTSP